MAMSSCLNTAEAVDYVIKGCGMKIPTCLCLNTAEAVDYVIIVVAMVAMLSSCLNTAEAVDYVIMENEISSMAKCKNVSIPPKQ